MKKTYIQPSVMVVHTETTYLLNSGSSLETKTGQATEWGGAKGGSMLWSEDDFAYEDYEDE